VQRHPRLEFGFCIDPLEIHMQHQGLIGVHLIITQQYLLGLTIDFKIKNRLVEGFHL